MAVVWIPKCQHVQHQIPSTVLNTQIFRAVVPNPWAADRYRAVDHLVLSRKDRIKLFKTISILFFIGFLGILF